MLVPFAEFGVTQGMIEAKLGNKLEAVSENQLASLRRVYKALKDGVGKREDYFKPEASKPEFSSKPGKPRQEAPPMELPPGADDDGDLGPQKSTAQTAAAQSEPERKVQPQAPEPPPAARKEPSGDTAEQTVKRQVKALKTLLGMKGHDEVQLMRFLAAEKCLDDSLGTLSELGKIAPQMLGQIHDTFGKIEVELKAWKEAQK
jgi:hypothetical protein